MKYKHSSIQQGRPSTPSMETQASAFGGFKGDGKNKSVWQTFVDGEGFSKRHPNIVLMTKNGNKGK
ncbi:hypothetical protein CMI37_28985 [Candidatus Pacearchaeota archaeon]|nr:hypothetical protein [Candidatus Pacearchaeota archaeon]|tara:strand:+ start:303 stop:500 length:198 start_codon:yes stop_codon:yes gene_type:complete